MQDLILTINAISLHYYVRHLCAQDRIKISINEIITNQYHNRFTFTFFIDC